VFPGLGVVILAANLIGAQIVAGKPIPPDLNEYGTRRIGEIGLTGSSLAVASAVYHAPESRVRCRFASRNCHKRKRGRFQVHENK
jgi:hypothetical protein